MRLPLFQPSLFANRADAGAQLAARVARHLGEHEPALVLALPRGGVIVGAAIARALRVPLDVVVARKLGVPQQPELAMGAITRTAQVLLPDVIASFEISDETLEAVIAAEQAELTRREALYRGNRPLPELRDKCVILTDDGIATGATMLAAIATVRPHRPRQVIVAAPVVAFEALPHLARKADRVAYLVAPKRMGSIGLWYQDFHQVSDDEVRAALQACATDAADALQRE